MAKVSMINREKKRTKLVGKFATKRAELKAIIADPEVGFEEKQQAMFSL
jgi:small subunit ribosomal protein S14